MNMEIEKKEYIAPAMTVIEMETEASLLSNSEPVISNDDDFE